MLIIDVLPSYFSINNVTNLNSEKWFHFLGGDNRMYTFFSLNNLSASVRYPAFILEQFHFNTLSVLLFIIVITGLCIGVYILGVNNFKLKRVVASVIKEQQILIEDFEVTITALEQSKEEISQQNLFIKQLAIILAHDLQSPFRFMKMNTETLHQSILTKQYDEAAALSIELKQSSEHTYRFITDFTLWLRSIHKDYKPKLEEVNLYEMINDLNSFFACLLKSRKNKWHQEVPHDLKVFTDKELLKVIVRNIIDNANKHNFERTIKIASHTTSENCDIIISDDGTGLSDTALHHIHTYINHSKNPGFDTIPTDNKNGHKLIAHFSRLLNLDINISSKTNMGTTFRVAKLVRI